MTTERFALVTGASSGIGRAIARELAEHHFDLLICADEPGITDAATELGARGVDVQALQLDLRNRGDVERLNESIIASGRPLDAAVLNAGVARGGAFLSTDLDDHLEVIDLNIRSTVHLTHRVVTYMVARNTGRLLLTSSIAAAMPGRSSRSTTPPSRFCSHSGRHCRASSRTHR